MEEERTPQIRIIVKKKKGHGGHHGGAWKVAYADFVTAMMALFIVLWIVGQNATIKHSIAAYFTDPGAFSETTRRGGIDTGPSTAAAPVPKPQISFEGNVEAEMEKLKVESKKIADAISSVPAFEKFKDKIQISVTEEGMRIELIENSQGLFFDVGSAQVKAETVKLLKLIAGEIGKLQNPVVIEGYTDSRPFVTPGYTNWELSTDRANAARKLLEENGLARNQVTQVRGYADRVLKHPDKPLDFANRRVNILVPIIRPKGAEPVSGPASPGEGKNK
jgi:chemotaxis protein MotB